MAVALATERRTSQDVKCMGELIIPIIGRLPYWAVRFGMRRPLVNPEWGNW